MRKPESRESEEREQESVDQLLTEVCRFHHGQIRATFHSLGLHQGQPRLLMVLWQDEGRTHTELAAALHVQPATITKMVQRMEKVGFVERRSDPTDERVSRVYLTRRGREIEHQVKSRLKGVDARAIGDFSPQDRQALTGLLRRLRDNLLKSNEQNSEARC